jgi:hypothetical protein
MLRLNRRKVVEVCHVHREAVLLHVLDPLGAAAARWRLVHGHHHGLGRRGALRGGAAAEGPCPQDGSKGKNCGFHQSSLSTFH